MTKLLEEAIKAIRQLPEERQNELAELLVAATKEGGREYSQEQIEAIDAGLADAEAGRFATDEEVSALFSKYRAA